MSLSQRAQNEIEHGKELATMDTEAVWGWGTPAGRLRAEKRSAIIIEGADLIAGQRVLEIGCGTGNFTEMFARTGAQIVAVDISPELLEKARARDLPISQVQFLQQRFEDCDAIGPFDAVIGSSVLHHLDIQPALSKIFELLKPGGRLSFAEPNMLNPQVFLERKLSFFRPLFWYVSPDETAFVRWSLRARMMEAGFDNVEIKPLDWLHPLVPSTLISFVSKVEKHLEKTAILREFAGSLYIRARRPV
jgi:2-polyprenyl-3-methyl-5-hydroxy-6-metoxy-1,4-benzoquinol methylase